MCLNTYVQNVVLNMMNELKCGYWNLPELEEIDSNGLKVFSCFHCGGGSTMGYKLAGYDVVGGVEIDQKMVELYRTNFKPKHSYFMGVKEFCNIPDNELPKELFELDILDGSPPCASFSMSGNREKNWGDKKKFREGQVDQVLDDLFFDFIEIAKKLKPKVVIAENVKGLIQGKAKGYVKQIFKAFKDAGYSCQLFLLNAAFMGVPQRRERVFFIANRVGIQKLSFDFREKPIPFNEIEDHQADKDLLQITSKEFELWDQCQQGRSLSSVHHKKSYFNANRLHKKRPIPTLASGSCRQQIHPTIPRRISDVEIIRAQTFPQDYTFLNQDVGYVCGMSVPPFMMQRLSLGVRDQIFDALNKEVCDG